VLGVLVRKLVKFAKLTALLSAAWTLLCAAIVTGLPISDGAEVYRVSTIVWLMRGSTGGYFTASLSEARAESTLGQSVATWLLELPVVAPLLFAAVLLFIFYRWLAVLESQQSQRST
jgi:hypothetical protein